MRLRVLPICNRLWCLFLGCSIPGMPPLESSILFPDPQMSRNGHYDNTFSDLGLTVNNTAEGCAPAPPSHARLAARRSPRFCSSNNALCGSLPVCVPRCAPYPYDQTIRPVACRFLPFACILRTCTGQSPGNRCRADQHARLL